ncbi:hypothetical protein QTI66_32940 [Variovorax sp. J22R133]|uniref:hypothetical protein n=1 Tax=Variovorax brevis TaxID=3053503 RepID=UPI0025757B74|nr:hypothetical protein [Variovorax sp. J22R133]MDM0116936.1 hypothetical protein [Variovorax sp. J22R133]
MDTMTEADIRARLAEIDPSLSIQDISGAKTSSRRKTQGMEPFTYFVIVFTAHLAAGMTHDLVMQLVKKKLADKNPQVEQAPPTE